MSNDEESGPTHLLAVLKRDFGDALRSLVEYTPGESRIHYLREDIASDTANGRLVRIEQLYQAERLNNSPITQDPELDRLHVSLFCFDGALVVHLVDEGGAVLGFSLDRDTHVDLVALRDYFEAAFGYLPESLGALT
jgi:hypothetical protein